MSRISWKKTAGLVVCLFAAIIIKHPAEASECRIVWEESGPSISGVGASEQNGNVLILSGGTYHISGETTSGRVEIKVPEDEEVCLLFENMRAKVVDTPGILALSGKVTIFMEGTDNYISGGNEDYPAAIYCKDALVIGGDGKLMVEGNYEHGIESRDNLLIQSGTIEVTSVKDAIRGRDNLTIEDGTVIAKAGQDGLKANNDEDAGMGNVCLQGGNVTLEVADDAIHGEGTVQISGGTLEIINCLEGIEGHVVEIQNGTIDVVAVDDAMNANGDLTALMYISGGEIILDAQGDGIDSNGKFQMDGGNLIINGPTVDTNSPLDYDGITELQGGIMVAAGSVSMPQAPKSVGERTTLRVMFETYQQKGQLFTIRDGQGKVLITFAPKKGYQMIIMAHPSLVKGQRISLSVGGSAEGLTPGTYSTEANVEGDTFLCEVTLGEALTSVNQKGEPCEYILTTSNGW